MFLNILCIIRWETHLKNSGAVVLKLQLQECHLEYHSDCKNSACWASAPEFLFQAEQGGLKICISPKFPGDPDAAALGTTLLW